METPSSGPDPGGRCPGAAREPPRWGRGGRALCAQGRPSGSSIPACSKNKRCVSVRACVCLCMYIAYVYVCACVRMCAYVCMVCVCVRAS